MPEQEKGEGPPAPEKAQGPGEQAANETAVTAPPAPPRTPTSEEQALQERYLRLAAEFDNFRKRSERDMAEFRKRAQDAILVSVLDVVDSLDRALEAPAQADAARLREGVAAIRSQLWHVLEREGVRPIEAVGRRFDPFEMEAALRMPSADVPEGGVLQEIQRGYRGRQHVLRPSKVIVSSGPPPATEAPAGPAPEAPAGAQGERPQRSHHAHQPHQSHQPHPSHQQHQSDQSHQSHNAKKHHSEEDKE